MLLAAAHQCVALQRLATASYLLQAGERGGAMFLSNVHPARISAVNISDAEAQDGGGIASQYGSMAIANGTIIRRTKVRCPATSPARLGACYRRITSTALLMLPEMRALVATGCSWHMQH